MSTPGSPAEARAFIVERLVGDIGEPDAVLETARALADRALPSLRSHLSAFLATPVAVEVREVALARVPDVRPAAADTSAVVVVASPTSPDALMISLDGVAISILVTALFGGDAEMPAPVIDRPLSATELRTAKLALEAAAKAVNGTGERAFNFQLPSPPPVSGSDLIKLPLRDGPGVRADYSIALGGSRGLLRVVMPQRVLLKHRSDRVPTQDEAGSQAEWGSRFGEEIMRAGVELEATMPLGRLTLGEVSSLKVGQVLELPDAARGDVRLSARNKTLFVCEFGKLGQNYTVRVRSSFDAGRELLEDLMAG